MNKEVELGDVVECIYTGFKGTAVAMTTFINGCIQVAVLPTVKDNKSIVVSMPEEVGIDIQSLKVVKKGALSLAKKKKAEEDEEPRSSGGAMTRNLSHRNF